MNTPAPISGIAIVNRRCRCVLNFITEHLHLPGEQRVGVDALGHGAVAPSEGNPPQVFAPLAVVSVVGAGAVASVGFDNVLRAVLRVDEKQRLGGAVHGEILRGRADIALAEVPGHGGGHSALPRQGRDLLAELLAQPGGPLAVVVVRDELAVGGE